MQCFSIGVSTIGYVDITKVLSGSIRGYMEVIFLNSNLAMNTPLRKNYPTAIKALTRLQLMGFTEKDIAKLIGLGYGYRKLDNELISKGELEG